MQEFTLMREATTEIFKHKDFENVSLELSQAT